MDRQDILAFAHRDWQALGVLKTAYWAERFRQDGWRPAWEAADSLLLDMRRARLDYPTDEDRDADLADHVALCNRLDHVADALARR